MYDEPPKETEKHYEMYEASYHMLNSFGVEIQSMTGEVIPRIQIKERK